MDTLSSNIETFLLGQAVECGVVRKIVKKTAKNPNKLHKQLAPWFNEECKSAKKAF